MRLTLTGALAVFLLLASAGAAPAAEGSGPVSPAARAPLTPANVHVPQHPGPAPRQAPAPRPLRELPVNSFVAAVIWLLAILAVGIATLPLAWALFPYLEDRGAGFAKVLGLALSTFLATLLVRYRVFSQGSLVCWASLSLVALASALCLLLRGGRMTEFWRRRRRAILAGEVVFGLGFLLFLGLRSFNPEIYWGEKPMDFSILNILVRSRALPTSDPWFSGAPLGYYVFGQQMVAFLTLLTTLSTRFTFNLAFGLLGGTVAQGAFCLARDWGGRLRAGLAGLGFTLLLGNLSGLREWLITQPHKGPRHLDWHYFWATSRVVPDTINEYPLWSLLFADLHAHVLALPLFLLVAACALQLVRAHADPGSRATRRVLCAFVLGFAAAVQVLTNAWDAPLLAGLFVLLFLLTALSDPRPRLLAFLSSAVSFLAAGAAALAAVRPLWVRGGGAPGFGWNAERGARGVDVLTHFGFFFFLCLVWWAVAAFARLPRSGPEPEKTPRWLVYLVPPLVLAAGFFSAEALCAAGILLFLFAIGWLAERPEDRLAFGLLATAFFLVLFPQRLFIYDRMNTFFKLYAETWPLFAIATAVLVFGSSERAGSFGNWPGVFRGVFVFLLACCLFTSVTAARGAIFAEGNPSRPEGGPGAPSLDGLRYLEKLRPGEYRAVLWLRRTLPGTPVVLEAQGGSYQEFSRISMLTGFPTVLGWEHHVKQRGNPQSEVDARRQAVLDIYSSTDRAYAERLLRRYHVGYVYVGWLERQTYPRAGLRKFETTPDLFQAAYANQESQVYRVVGGDSQDVITAPVHETVPAAQAPAHTGDEPEEQPVIRDKAEAGQAPFSGMKEPRGAAVDARGRIWVADFGNSRLRIFDPVGGYLGGWGGRGSGTFGLREPCAVAIRDDAVYVADTWNGRVQAFTLDGKWKATARDLFGPRGVTVAPDGTVWVSDTGNKRLVALDGELKQLRTLGRLGKGPVEFSDPVGIAAGRDGSLFIADAGNQRIQILDSDGHFVRQIPIDDWKMGVEPQLDVDEDGTLYVTDPPRNAVLQMDPTGALKKTYNRDDAGQDLSRPSGVAIDRKNRLLYVINSGNNRISKIELPGGKRP